MNRQLRLDTTAFTANETSLNQHTTFQLLPQTIPNSHPSYQATIPSQFQPVYDEKLHHPPQHGHFDQQHGPDFPRYPTNETTIINEIGQSRRPSEMHGQQGMVLPRSPGLAVKENIDILGHVPNSSKMSVVPDANPLQSPKSPYFPPPTTPGASELTTHRPGQISHPNLDIKGGTWKHGLCDCTSIGTCCLGLFCPCILYGRTQYRLSMKSKKGDPTNLLGYKTCNGSCTSMALLCGCQWLMATIQHTRTRKAYAIEGSIASDCVRATCCTCCILIQNEKEIRKREEEREKALRASGVPFLSPYLAPVPMSYPTLPT